MPEIVQTPPMERARTALAAGAPDDAIAVLRPALNKGGGVKVLLAQALVASGWNDVKVYRWNGATRKAREALDLSDPEGQSHGAHALLGEALYALRDFNAALGEFTKALAEAPRDARLKRRVIRSRRQLRHPPPGSTANGASAGASSKATSPSGEPADDSFDGAGSAASESTSEQ